MDKNTSQGIIKGFLNSADKFPDRPALEVDSRVYSYAELAQLTSTISETISRSNNDISNLVGVFAHRSITAYSSVLGILASGKGYVPINPKFPVDRIHTILTQSGCNTLIVGKEFYEILKEYLSRFKHSLNLIIPDSPKLSLNKRLHGIHQITSSEEMVRGLAALNIPEVDPDSPAYVLFTSGTTGIPKGIPVSHNNLASYIDYVCKKYQFDHNDRCSQAFDMTFDPSVHDMFVTWQVGACLCSVPESDLIAPGKFITRKNLSVWYSVPSIPMCMQRMRLLKPNAFPNLRYSIFSGEALPVTVAQSWQKAAPQSTIINFYGPTEVTINFTDYVWDRGKSIHDSVNGIVPIGWVFDTHKTCIINDKLKLVPQGEKGELCVAGKQVTYGYLNNPEKSAEHFIKIPSLGDNTWYRTGDLVKEDARGCFYYLGRIDHQVQIRGFRVELTEIEAILKKEIGTEMVVALPWPINESIAQGIIAFIANESHSLNMQSILRSCQKQLPDYMVPKEIYFLDALPLSINGKIDRKALMKMLEEKYGRS